MMTSVRKAFVLGAGLGTRLLPLTQVLPKPLIPIYGKPLITFAFDHLISLGIESLIVNTHHLASKFDSYFKDNHYEGRSLRLVFESEILETGGAIWNIEHLIGNEPFVVYSGDVLTDIDIAALIEAHFHQKADVTLALRHTGLSTDIAFQDGMIIDIRNQLGVAQGEIDFAGVSIWNPTVFQRIPSNTKTSFFPILIEWLRQGGRIGGVCLDQKDWFNIGSRREYLDTHQTVWKEGWHPSYLQNIDWPRQIEHNVYIAPSAKLEGWVSIDSGCSIEEEVFMRNSVVWKGAKICRGASLEDCVVTSGASISGQHSSIDLV